MLKYIPGQKENASSDRLLDFLRIDQGFKSVRGWTGGRGSEPQAWKIHRRFSTQTQNAPFNHGEDLKLGL
jgi:hypothetical protein